jgi:hypothetical protein
MTTAKWAAAGAAWVGVVGGVGWLATRSPDAGSPPTGPAVYWYDLPEVLDPPNRPAAEAGLPDDTPVLGVSAGGRFRAYPLAALNVIRNHVVNDRLGGQAITVTFCGRTGCSRVFTAPSRLSMAGWAAPTSRLGGGMLLRDGPKVYRQDTGQPIDGSLDRLALPEVPAVRTTWGAWRAEHPDTDVSLTG